MDLKSRKSLQLVYYQIISWNFKFLPVSSADLIVPSPQPRPCISVGHEGNQFKIWKFYYICKIGHWIYCWCQFQCRNNLNPHFISFIFKFSRLSCWHWHPFWPSPVSARPCVSPTPCWPSPMTLIWSTFNLISINYNNLWLHTLNVVEGWMWIGKKYLINNFMSLIMI